MYQQSDLVLYICNIYYIYICIYIGLAKKFTQVFLCICVCVCVCVYIYILFQILFPHRLLQILSIVPVQYSRSLLFILHIVVSICYPQIPNLSLPPTFPLW